MSWGDLLKREWPQPEDMPDDPLIRRGREELARQKRGEPSPSNLAPRSMTPDIKADLFKVKEAFDYLLDMFGKHRATEDIKDAERTLNRLVEMW